VYRQCYSYGGGIDLQFLVKRNCYYGIYMPLSRRLTHELKSWPHYWHTLEDERGEESKSNEVSIIYVRIPTEDLRRNTFLSIILRTPSSYPFAPPKATFLNGDPVHSMFRPSGVHAGRILTRLHKEIGECLCCASLLCKANWNCHQTLQKVVDQLKLFLSFQTRVSDIMMAEKVVDQHFGHYIPIVEFL